MKAKSSRMAKLPKVKISVRVDANQYEFLQSRSILWNCTVSKFTEDMIGQGIMTEKKKERSEAWQDREAKRNEQRMLDELDQSEEAIQEREEIARSGIMFTPKSIRKAINETERRNAERRAAISKGIEPPRYEKSAWDDVGRRNNRPARESPQSASGEADGANPQ